MRLIMPYFLFLIHKNNKLYLVYLTWLDKTSYISQSSVDVIVMLCRFGSALRKIYKYASAYASESEKRRCAYTTLEEEFILDYCSYA